MAHACDPPATYLREVPWSLCLQSKVWQTEEHKEIESAGIVGPL